MGVPFERRPIERTELLAADECDIAGTISELTLVQEIDGFSFGSRPPSRLRRRYIEIMRGEAASPGIDLVPLTGGRGRRKCFRTRPG